MTCPTEIAFRIISGRLLSVIRYFFIGAPVRSLR